MTQIQYVERTRKTSCLGYSSISNLPGEVLSKEDNNYKERSQVNNHKCRHVLRTVLFQFLISFKDFNRISEILSDSKCSKCLSGKKGIHECFIFPCVLPILSRLQLKPPASSLKLSALWNL